MTKVFISYRRDDTQWQADRLYKALRAYLPKRNIFMDIDSIALGEDFEARLTKSVSDCDIMFAVIGPAWLSLRDADGQRRLDNEHDFVRVELEAAFSRGIRVVPILVNGATLPARADLPESLRKLPVSQGFEPRRVSFESDIEHMLRGLGIARRNSGVYLALGAVAVAIAAFALWGGGGETARCVVNPSGPGCAEIGSEVTADAGVSPAAAESSPDRSAPDQGQRDRSEQPPPVSVPVERASATFRVLAGRWDFPEGNCLAPYVLRVQGDRLTTTSVRWNAESRLSAGADGSITATAVAPAQIAGKTYDYSFQNDRLHVRDNTSGAVQEYKACV